jgi:hypothetical protein
MLIFGDKWEKKHGRQPNGEWNNVFLAFDERQLTKGIDNMRKDAEHKIRSGDEAWPPNAFEFACLCKKTSSLYFPSNMPPAGDVKLLSHKTEFDGLSPAECLKTIRGKLA